MNKIKAFLKNKLFIRSVLLISILLNILFIFFAKSPVIPISKQIIIGSTPPYDTENTVYLAHGVVAFRDKKDQPKNTYQVMTFYIDTQTKKTYVDEAFLLNDVLSFMGRSELVILSYNDNSKILTLSGDGWDKIVIDTEKKQVIEATDSTGDIIYLRSTWEVK